MMLKKLKKFLGSFTPKRPETKPRPAAEINASVRRRECEVHRPFQ